MANPSAAPARNNPVKLLKNWEALARKHKEDLSKAAAARAAADKKSLDGLKKAKGQEKKAEAEQKKLEREEEKRTVLVKKGEVKGKRVKECFTRLRQVALAVKADPTPANRTQFQKAQATLVKALVTLCKYLQQTRYEDQDLLPDGRGVWFLKKLKQLTLVMMRLAPTNLEVAEDADAGGDAEEPDDMTELEGSDLSAVDQAIAQMEEGEEEEEEGEDEGGAAVDAARWEARWGKLSPALAKVLRAKPANAAELQRTASAALKEAGAGGHAQALELLDKLQLLMKGALAALVRPQGALPAEGLAAWQAAREKVVGDIRKAAAAIAATKDPHAAPAIIELQSILANLTAKPQTPQAVAELERYLQTDAVITDAEGLPPRVATLRIREPLLSALKQLKS